MNAVAAAVLVVLALFLVGSALIKLRSERGGGPLAAQTDA